VTVVRDGRVAAGRAVLVVVVFVGVSHANRLLRKLPPVPRSVCSHAPER
jgi:hypothetical protein